MWPNDRDQRRGYSGYSNPPPRRFRPSDSSSDEDPAPSNANRRRILPAGARLVTRQRPAPTQGNSPSISDPPPRRLPPGDANRPRILPAGARLVTRQRPAPTQGNRPSTVNLAERSTQSSAPRKPGAPCEVCYNMDPRKRPAKSGSSMQNPDVIKILLVDFVRESDNCPFCNLLHRMFLEYVDDAKDKIKGVQKGIRFTIMDTPAAFVSVKPDQPAKITFSEGMHQKSSIKRDDVVNEAEKKDPNRLYYPMPIQVYRHTGEQIPGWPRLGVLKDPDQELDGSFQFFKDKLRDCIGNHHGTCHPVRPDLPRRLIYIGSSDDDVVKLVDSSTLLSNRPVYAAVSHRWTDPKLMFRTLKENFKDHQKRINLGRSPGVLQDAVRVARALGVKYLWMDTVCLIQDDSDDKGSEIGKMGDYYANAYFTIAASSSKNTLAPFLDRNSYYKPHMFPFGKNGDSAVYSRRLGVEGFLANRGWIWQESALSGRVLNFAPSELIWECRHEVESECGYKPGPYPSLGLARKYRDIGKEPFKVWQELVQIFSARKLGYFNDLLPGISGMAKRIQGQTRSLYHAGIWEQDMIPGLLWQVRVRPDRVTNPLPRVPHPKDPNTEVFKQCRAPSWSWASVEGQVSTTDTDTTSSMKPSFEELTRDVRNLEVKGLKQLTPGSIVGEVAGGLLKLKGCLIPITLEYADELSGPTYMLTLRGKRDLKMRFSPDTELELSPEKSRADGQTVRRTNNMPKDNFSVTVHCLRIATEPPRVAGQRLTDYGLVLARSKDNSNYFTRIGFFKFTESSYFDDERHEPITIA